MADSSGEVVSPPAEPGAWSNGKSAHKVSFHFVWPDIIVNYDNAIHLRNRLRLVPPERCQQEVARPASDVLQHTRVPGMPHPGTTVHGGTSSRMRQ